MNYRSLQNLETGFEAYVAEQEEVTLFTAYIKMAALLKINSSQRINQIVVRWQSRDFCGASPASDLEEIWNYCKEHNIKLFRNTRLHMKVIWNNDQEAIVGSANITRNGLGLSTGANLEFAARVELGQEDMLYLNTLLLGNATTLVTDELYHVLKQTKNQYAEVQRTEIPEVQPTEVAEGKFLTNQLPMFNDVVGMYEAILNPNELDPHARNCLLHDAALYEVDGAMSEEIFYETLKSNFLKHPFIVAFLEEVRNRHPHRNTPDRPSMNFGAVKDWFARNTIEVPAPRRWQLEPYVQVLYEWIEHLSDGEFTWSRPNHSQVLFYNG